MTSETKDHAHSWFRVVGIGAERLAIEDQYMICSECNARMRAPVTAIGRALMVPYYNGGHRILLQNLLAIEDQARRYEREHPMQAATCDDRPQSDATLIRERGITRP